MAAQQAGFLPAPQFETSYRPILQPTPASTTKATAGVAANKESTATTATTTASSKRVTVEDGDDEDDDAEYFARKEREIAQLEERLKRHAAVAHGVKQISNIQTRTSVAPSNETTSTALPSPTSAASADKENAIDAPISTTTIGSGRGFGHERSSNLPHTPSNTALTGKKKSSASTIDLSSPFSPELVRRAERELARREELERLHRDQQDQSLTERQSSRNRVRPATATSRRIDRPTSSSASRASSTTRPTSAREVSHAHLRPRSMNVRPSTAQTRSRTPNAHAREADENVEAYDEDLTGTRSYRSPSIGTIEVSQIDTQRSLRKTHAHSVKGQIGNIQTVTSAMIRGESVSKMLRLMMRLCDFFFLVVVLVSVSKLSNPRYGAGGYRKSDPVTRYHSFKSKWEQSKFLKHNMKESK